MALEPYDWGHTPHCNIRLVYTKHIYNYFQVTWSFGEMKLVEGGTHRFNMNDESDTRICLSKNILGGLVKSGIGKMGE